MTEERQATAANNSPELSYQDQRTSSPLFTQWLCSTAASLWDYPALSKSGEVSKPTRLLEFDCYCCTTVQCHRRLFPASHDLDWKVGHVIFCHVCHESTTAGLNNNDRQRFDADMLDQLSRMPILFLFSCSSSHASLSNTAGGAQGTAGRGGCQPPLPPSMIFKAVSPGLATHYIRSRNALGLSALSHSPVSRR